MYLWINIDVQFIKPIKSYSQFLFIKYNQQKVLGYLQEFALNVENEEEAKIIVNQFVQNDYPDNISVTFEHIGILEDIHKDILSDSDITESVTFIGIESKGIFYHTGRGFYNNV